MIRRKTWQEFRNTGLLWFVNMILHTFGWVIVFDMDENREIIEVYPARTIFRGFAESINTEGYVKVSQYMRDNADELVKEAEDE
jgi:hypothetical protein